jgi:hypothetical protein
MSSCRTFIFARRATALSAGLIALFLPLRASWATPTGALPPRLPVSGAATQPLSEALAQLGKRTGVLVVADSTVGNPSVPVALASLPGSAAAARSAAISEPEMERILRQFVAALPAGRSAIWTKLYLPPPPPGRAWTGEAVAAFARAQAALFGPAGTDAVAAAATPARTPPAAAAGVVEILGRRFEGDTARAYVAGLGLRPVYLITSADPRTQTAAAGAAGPLLSWAQLPREQREQMAAQILNMDPALRNQMMQGLVGVFRNVLGQMSPDDRAAMFQGTGINLGNGTASLVQP